MGSYLIIFGKGAGLIRERCLIAHLRYTWHQIVRLYKLGRRKKVRAELFYLRSARTARIAKQKQMATTRGGGGYSPKFRIGVVCRERSQALTLSKDKENEN